MRLCRALCLFLLVALAVGWPPGTPAQTSAAQPLRILVPLPAGSTSDILARLIADRLRVDLARPVVVDNRPGATGRIAVEALKGAAPDGSTILLAPMALPVIVPLVFKDARFDGARDLAPIAQVTAFEYALAVAPDHPAQNLREFIAWAKTLAVDATYGTPASGSIPHFLGAMLASAAGVDLLHIPYKGAPQLETDLMGGRIASGISAVSDFAALARAGKLRILATSGANRSHLFPEVPTFAEQGFESVEATGWHAFYAPAKTPRVVIDHLAAALAGALRAPSLHDALAPLGIVPTVTSPQTLADTMATDVRYWRRRIEATGFRAD